MLNLKKILTGVGLVLSIIGFGLYPMSKQAVPVFSGYVTKIHQWNNYGYALVIYKDMVEIAKTQTAINGYFSFTVLPGTYDLYVYKDSAVVVIRAISVPSSIRIALPNQTPPFYPVETIGFFIAVLILGLGVMALVLQRNMSGLIFFGMTLGFAFVNGIEWLQSVLALSNEILAGTIFSLKHAGFVWFGIFLLMFVQYLARQRLALWLIFIGIIETIILVSWLWLGSDLAFVTVWRFPYAALRDFCVLQTFMLIVMAYVVSVRTAQRPLLRAGLLWFLVLFCILVVVPIALQHSTEFFALQYNIAASIGGLILFLSLFSVLMTFKVRGMEQFVAGSLMYSIMSIVLIGIYAVVIVAFGRFIQYAKNELLSLYALLLVVIAVLPFKDILQKHLEQRLLGDTQRYSEALTVLTERLGTAVTFVDLQNTIRQVFKKYFNVSAKIIRAASVEGITYVLHTDEKNTLAISCSLEKVFAQTEVAAFEKACAPISLAMNRVLAYEKQLKALTEIEQQARLASLGTLTAGLAHEIKNPLAVIQNIVSVLPRSSAVKLKTEYVPLLQRQVERMQLLLHNMLQFARPEKLAIKKINFKFTVAKSVALIAATARKQNVIIETKLRDWFIYGDERALEQVILNICLNALESMPAGGNLRLIFKKQALLITDTGCGMDAHTQKRLFDPFFTTKANGSGLGLAISKRILEKHQATLTVISQSKKGTTFTVEFKRSQ